MKRQIVIGDIHGCIIELKALLEKIRFDKDKDFIMFTGDLFDRGDYSYEVFQFMKGLKDYMGDRCVIIRGNHEDMFLNDHRIWMFNGAMDTINSFENNNCSLDELKNFVINNTALYYKDENIQCAHASCSDIGIEETSKDILIWDRYNFKEGWYGGRTTIIGHTPILNPMVTWNDYDEDEYKNIIYKYGRRYDFPKYGLLNIDTGCVFGKKLTAMIYYPGTNTMIFHKVDKKLWTEDKI